MDKLIPDGVYSLELEHSSCGGGVTVLGEFTSANAVADKIRAMETLFDASDLDDLPKELEGYEGGNFVATHKESGMKFLAVETDPSGWELIYDKPGIPPEAYRRWYERKLNS